MNGPVAVTATQVNVIQTMTQPAPDSPLRITRRMWTDAIADPMTRATPSRTLISSPCRSVPCVPPSCVLVLGPSWSSTHEIRPSSPCHDRSMPRFAGSSRHLSYNKQASNGMFDRHRLRAAVAGAFPTSRPTSRRSFLAILLTFPPRRARRPSTFLTRGDSHGSPQGRDRGPAERRQVVAVQLAGGPEDRHRRRHGRRDPRPRRRARAARRRRRTRGSSS